MNVFSYWNSDKLALRAHNAQEVDETTAPELVAMVRQLAERAQMPMPRVYVIHDPQPNAFATGRNPQNAAVAATTGIMELLSWEELAGVMAHELAHIRNHDTLTMTVTATLAGAISSIANFGLFFGGGRDRPNPVVMIAVSVLAPMAAMVVQMAISRSREYEADKLGGEICGNPAWLAGALAKIAGGVAQIPSESAERHPQTAHMFIINPLSGQGFEQPLLHPPQHGEPDRRADEPGAGDGARRFRRNIRGRRRMGPASARAVGLMERSRATRGGSRKPRAWPRGSRPRWPSHARSSAGCSWTRCSTTISRPRA